MRSLGAFIAAWLVVAAGPASAASAVAQVERIEGRGEYREARQSAWSAAKVKQDLFDGDFVRTLDMSKMAILFTPHKEVMQIPANSQLQVTGDADRKTIDLQRGRGWFKSQGNPRGLEVRTPSATAAIRGTEWEIDVDDEGRTTLSVFSGEVDFFNDQGRVTVAPNEQAMAERGKAPVKLTLRVSRERVQWVSSFTVDARRYGDAGVARIGELIAAQQLAEAYAELRRAVAAGAPANAELLLADFEIYRGDLRAAEGVLRQGASRHPADERFDVALARIALLSDRSGEALAIARGALAKRRDSHEALLAIGDIERHEGRAREATAAYARAAAIAAKDARPWLGLGIIESERENVRPARSHLERAIALDPEEAGAYAELGTLEGFAGRHAAGRERLRKALALQPHNYVALTGLGVIELRAGNVEAALDALSRAALLEPRYARAHLYLAAARYQMEQDGPALEELKRAMELDPKDPVPHMLASIIHLDRIEPGRAAQAAQEALERLPFLKSLNPVADNQKGIANVGYPLSFMGLEAWARSAAHESYLPFWGGSHLFLADRYPGEFNRRSELMQGFITDPLAFGASNRYQSLFLVPGDHATASLAAQTSEDVRVHQPSITLNGYRADGIPFAYFVEAAYSRIEPRDVAFDVRLPTVTAALGAKLTPEVGAFLYASHLSADIDIGRSGVTGQFDHISGDATRVDAGMRYAPDVRSSLWVKAGAGDSDTTSDLVASLVVPNLALAKGLRFSPRLRPADIAARYTIEARDGVELTAGAEASRLRTAIDLQQDATFHLPGAAASQERLEERDRDRAQSVYAMGRATFGRWRVEGGATWRDYSRDRDFHATFENRPGLDVGFSENFRRRKIDPMIGIVWHASPQVLVRSACRRWLRPIAADTLMPVAVAGMPLEDQLVLPGGELEQCRAQLEWSARNRMFASAAIERIETRNLVSALDGVQHGAADPTNLERLRARVFEPPLKPDLLEDIPVYAGGVVRRASLALEQLVTPRIGASLHYAYTESENNVFPGLRVPFLARHQARLGLAWSPGWRTHVVTTATYRSRRFMDEANLAAMPAGWDGRVSVFVESAGKHWAIELEAANLFKKEASDVFGIVLSYRF